MSDAETTIVSRESTLIVEIQSETFTVKKRQRNRIDSKKIQYPNVYRSNHKVNYLFHDACSLRELALNSVNLLENFTLSFRQLDYIVSVFFRYALTPLFSRQNLLLVRANLRVRVNE